MRKITAKTNKQKRTFTLRMSGVKYRTNVQTKEQFEIMCYYTESDWHNFLRTSCDYYIA